jgi:hypothetical protein
VGKIVGSGAKQSPHSLGSLVGESPVLVPGKDAAGSLGFFFDAASERPTITTHDQRAKGGPSFGFYAREVVTAIDGQKVATTQELMQIVRKLPPGKAVKLSLEYHDKDSRTRERTVIHAIKRAPAWRGNVAVTQKQAEHFVSQAQSLCQSIWWLESPAGPALGIRLKASTTDQDLVKLSKLPGWACVQLVWGDSNGGKITEASVAVVTALPGIEAVSLHGREFTDKTAERLSQVSTLRNVRLAQTKVTDKGLAQLVKVWALEELELSDADVSDKGLEALKGMTELTELRLNSARVSDAGLAHLSGLPLRSLWLDRTEVSDKGLEHLKKIRSLEVVSLNGTKVSAEGREALRKALPKTKVLPESK